MVLVILAALAVQAHQRPTPARIVSTSPSITETLFALGLGDRVVGVSTYCWFPAEVAKRPRVGSYLKPDAELIARLKPDLVFVHSGPNATAKQLGTLGITTATVALGSLPAVKTTIREIGAAAGVVDRARRLIEEIESKLQRVQAAVAGRPPRRVLMIVGRQTGTLADLVGVGPGSYLNDIATIAGGTNVLAGRTLPEYPRISMETVISLAPEVIIDVGEMADSPESSNRRLRATEELWKRQALVRAGRDGGVHATTDQAFVVPGPRIVRVAETMAEWFHGVRFQ